MNILSAAEFKQLSTFNNKPCISIFMPTNRAGKDVLGEKDRIQLKTLWKEVVEKLEAKNVDGEKIRELDGILDDVMKDHDFWRHQMDGLVIFVAKDFFQKFKTPIGFEPRTYISDHFYIKPILPLFDDRDEFYLLALQIENVRFFKANEYSIEEVKIDELAPSRLEERVGFDFEERTRLHQSLGNGKAVMQGDDAANRARKNEILRYFNAVDAGLQDILHDEKAPLVVACQDYLFPIYKDANSYQHLFPVVLPGNPSDSKNDKELHEKACRLLEPYFNKDKQEKFSQYQELVPERKSNDIHQIIPAIFQGKVDTLFLQENRDVWGNYNENMASVNVSESENRANTSLTNLAAVKVIEQNGRVFLLPEEEMPVQNSPMVAVFRY